MYFFHSQTQQRQQYDYGFLFIPGKNEGKRKLIYRTSKCICKCHCNLYRTISVITLTHIHQSWQTIDFSKIKIIETEFATCQG